MSKPPWLRIRLPDGERCKSVRDALSGERLTTVCQHARCPNLAECWGAGTATFLILGDRCTRGCRFCAVTRGDPGGVEDESEGARVARAASRLGLGYVVVTSVTRDDLADGGASVFADTVRRLKELDPTPAVEVLVPDYLGDDLTAVLEAGPDVLAHNLEVVERLTPVLRHSRFDYRRSLRVLEEARGRATTKSSLMLGLGETEQEVEAAMGDLRAVGVDLLVLGQYLQPTPDHAPVAEYLTPETFERLGERARTLGFRFVASSPLARTSYRAAEALGAAGSTEEPSRRS